MNANVAAQYIEPNRFATANELARFNMIEQQIRPWEVLDPVVLDLIASTPREAFVSEEYQGLAFADIEIPLGHGQTMLSPKIEGRILQSLDIQPTDTVLEIGTGSGYLTALLAKLAKHVTSVELFDDLKAQAASRLAKLGLQNITLEVGDAAQGWSAVGFDVIVYTGSLPVAPSIAMKQALNVGGRLFAVVGEAPVMEAMLIKRIAEDAYKQDIIFETCLPPLLHAAQPKRFNF